MTNFGHCKKIAKELEAYASGKIYICPECGEHCTMEEIENDSGEIVYECSCGCVTEYEPEQACVYEYFSDCLDVEYRCGSDRRYRSVRVMVACGGPNIYIDTATKSVELYWWNERASYLLDDDTVEAVDAWAEDFWNC